MRAVSTWPVPPVRTARAAASILSASLLVAAALWISCARADDPDTLAIHADVSRTELSNGTGVIVGVIDSGVSSTHPALLDSQGNSRMVAAANFVDSEPTINDIAAPPNIGHGTAITGAILSNDPQHTGVAPGANYINARVIDSSDSISSNIVVMQGVDFAVANGANILNLSLNFPGAATDGSDRLDLMLDWAADQGVNVSVAAGNINAVRDANGNVQLLENPPLPVRSPASAYNVIAVGRTGVPPGNPLGPIGPTLDYGQVFDTSRSGPVYTPSGAVRDKPDIVAPGTNITLADNNWQTVGLWTPTGQNGTSISAALISGMMAQEIGYGLSHGTSTNPLVVKATMLNSAVKVLDKDGTPWHPNASSMVAGVLQVTSPMDLDSGTGQVDGTRMAAQYIAGQQGPGSVGSIGWDLNTVSGATPVDYTISGAVSGEMIDVTLDWLRHVTRTEEGDGVMDASDIFTAAPISNLDLTVLLNGSPVAESISTADNLQYLHFALPQAGTVTLEVDGVSYSDPNNPSEQYGLAWSVVPEPSTIVLAACGLLIVFLMSMHRRQAAE